VGFKDIILKNVKNFDNKIYIYVKMKVKEHNCPKCNSSTRNIHDYRMQPIKDIPMFDKKLILNIEREDIYVKGVVKIFMRSLLFLLDITG